MDITTQTTKNENGTVYTITGKINTLTSQLINDEFQKVLADAMDITIDIKDVDYVSSAGLRMFVTAQKIMKAKSGKMLIKNVQDNVFDIFEMTGLSRVFNIVRF